MSSVGGRQGGASRGPIEGGCTSKVKEGISDKWHLKRNPILLWSPEILAVLPIPPSFLILQIHSFTDIYQEPLACWANLSNTPCLISLGLLSFHCLPFSAVPQFSQPLLSEPQVSPTASEPPPTHPLRFQFIALNLKLPKSTWHFGHHTLYDTTCRRLGKGLVMAG